MVTALISAYQTDQTRQAALEAKAVGVIQADAIAVVLVLFGATGPIAAKVFALIGLVYLALSIASAAQVLLPRARFVLTSDDIKNSPTHGLAEMGQASEMTSPMGLVASNLVTASLIDLIRAGVLGTVAATIAILT